MLIKAKEKIRKAAVQVAAKNQRQAPQRSSEVIVRQDKSEPNVYHLIGKASPKQVVKK